MHTSIEAYAYGNKPTHVEKKPNLWRRAREHLHDIYAHSLSHTHRKETYTHGKETKSMGACTRTSSRYLCAHSLSLTFTLPPW